MTSGGGLVRYRPYILILGLGLLAACDQDVVTPPGPPPSLSLDAELRQVLERWGVVPIGPMPAQGTPRVELGRALFFDPVLSGNRDVACATCHHPATALGDGRSLPVGTGGQGLGPARTLASAPELVPRSSPSLLNVGLGMPYLFWDGRLSRHGPVATELDLPVPVELSNALAAQALLPLLDRREMRGLPGDVDVRGHPNELAELADDQSAEIWRAVVARLEAIPEYVERFRAAFPEATDGLRVEHVGRALAAFEMEAFTKSRSPFDRYLDRDDQALSTAQKRGALLFFGEAGCAGCHSGPFLGGQGFANVGVPQIGPGVGAEAPLDPGRGALFEGGQYRFAFRVAPLRNVELTAPYMHNGAFPTLEEVVRHYDDVPAGLRDYDPSHLHPDVRGLHRGDESTVEAVLAHLDPRVRVPLELGEDEIGQLVAFLEALTDPSARDLGHLVPATVPSGLPVPR